MTTTAAETAGVQLDRAPRRGGWSETATKILMTTLCTLFVVPTVLVAIRGRNYRLPSQA